MKADISRFRFDRGKNYTSVVAQQGRVQLDSDANEQRAIDTWLRATGLIDVVGRTGAPRHDAGFAITVPSTGDAIQIGAGRFYVYGLLCEALQAADYMQQLWLADPQPSAAVLLSDLASAGRRRSRCGSKRGSAWSRRSTIRASRMWRSARPIRPIGSRPCGASSPPRWHRSWSPDRRAEPCRAAAI
jgi:hypothetical protein